MFAKRIQAFAAMIAVPVLMLAAGIGVGAGLMSCVL